MNAIELELKDIVRACKVAVLAPVLSISIEAIDTRWAFKVQPNECFKARLVALDWKMRCDCRITFASVCRFNLVAIASVKSVINQHGQTVFLNWFLDKNELKSTIRSVKLFGVKSYFVLVGKAVD